MRILKEEGNKMQWQPPDGGNKARHTVMTHLSDEDHAKLVEISIKTNNKIYVIVRSMIRHCLKEQENK